MKRMTLHCICLLLLVMVVSCASPRKIVSLTPQEKERIDDLLSQRKLCMVNEIEEIDDGKTNVEYVIELVEWKCGKYAEKIKDLLFSEYGIDLGESWNYSNDLRQGASREITEAILMRRKSKKSENDENRNLRR